MVGTLLVSAIYPRNNNMFPATDINDNRRTWKRKYQQSLFLVVKRPRDDHPWQFPQGKWLPEETMRQVNLITRFPVILLIFDTC